MRHKVIAINGESWCRNVTGIERVAIETTRHLDALVPAGKIELVVPKNARNLPELKNIAVVTQEAEAHFFPKWTQVDFQKYVIRNRRLSMDFTNTCPFFAPGIAFIHDIYGALHPEDFKTRRDRLIRLYARLMYRTIARRAKKIITVSEFSKKTIMETYHVRPERIAVVYNGVGSYRDLEADLSIFDRFPILRARPFYFSLGSLSVRKNLKWIFAHARLFPDELFVISGKALNAVIPPELGTADSFPNVVMTGYLSDGEVKALYSRCRAFLLPSYFEGFGIPPLEALSCGAKVVISNATSLPEIYGDCAYYIDPDRPDVNLEELLAQEVAPPDALLKKYTFANTARQLYAAIQEFL